MSVQQAIEEAIAGVCRRGTGHPGRGGRTDAGVHATGQVAHVDLARDWDADKVREATNATSGRMRWAILAAERVADDFDARFSAVKPILPLPHHRPAGAAVAGAPPCWHVRHRLDVDAMHEAAQGFLGQHDFTTFRASQCQAKSPVKTLDAFAVAREGDVISLTCSARSFLHNQVRSMVGTLKLVGEGKLERGGPEGGARCGRPHPLRPGLSAGRAVSDAGRLLIVSRG